MRARQSLVSLTFVACLSTVTTATFGADLSGAVKVIDGNTIVVDGRQVRLYGIKVPELGNRCAVGSATVDCGRVARSALLDLTAGASIKCDLAQSTAGDAKPSAVCHASGYDLSEGMTYTGWAEADTSVTDRYVRFERDARRHHRGLWRRAEND